MKKPNKEERQQLHTWWDSLSNDEKRFFQIIRIATCLGMNDYGAQCYPKYENYIPEIIPHEEA